MHSHAGVAALSIPEGAKRIVLAGNPNTGKSVIFNYLSGLHAQVANFPGTTVDVLHGRMGPDAVVDTPGVYGVSSFTDEERIARDLTLEADLVIGVVDATHLERDLFLTVQLIDMGARMVVALNMMDEARGQGIEIDVDLLSELLGVPVFPTVAVRKEGLDDLRAGLTGARTADLHPDLGKRIAEIDGPNRPRAEAILLLEGDGTIAEANGVESPGRRDEIYRWRRSRVNAIVGQAVSRTAHGLPLSSTLGHWLMQPLIGVPVLLVVMFGMYKLLGELLAGNVVGFTEVTLGQGYWEPWIQGVVRGVLTEGSVLERVLTGEYGLLTMTVSYLFGVILPLVAGFYLLLAVLEDSGYLPRIAVLTDGLLRRMGLNGRAVIPMILGFGCVTMATMSVRALASKRERMIATYLMALAIPCSAQLGVILGILAVIGGGWYALAYVVTILGVFLVSGTLLARVLPGQPTELLLDLPPLRLPRPGNVLRKTLARIRMFMREVALFFALGALLLTALQITGALVGIQNALAPLTVKWLRLPAEAATAFVMGFVRRDFGAAGLYNSDTLDIHMTPMQSLVALVALTLFVPCIASVLIILKERGGRYLMAAWAGTLVTAFLVAGIVAQMGRFAG